jgi:hypothetical protein
MGDEGDLPLGRAALAAMLPFLESLVAKELANTTVRRHFGNAWLLGGEIIRSTLTFAHRWLPVPYDASPALRELERTDNPSAKEGVRASDFGSRQPRRREHLRWKHLHTLVELVSNLEVCLHAIAA